MFEWSILSYLFQTLVSLEKQKLLKMVLFLPTSLEDTGDYAYGISLIGSTYLSLHHPPTSGGSDLRGVLSTEILTGLPRFPGLPLGPLCPVIPGSPFGPISPFCPSIPGNPGKPCEESNTQ